jgi:hypothetical protein
MKLALDVVETCGIDYRLNEDKNVLKMIYVASL